MNWRLTSMSLIWIPNKKLIMFRRRKSVSFGFSRIKWITLEKSTVIIDLCRFFGKESSEIKRVDSSQRHLS